VRTRALGKEEIMDRIIRKSLLAVVAFTALVARGEVVFVEPPATQGEDGTTYPESRFGQPPSPPQVAGAATRAPAGFAAVETAPAAQPVLNGETGEYVGAGRGPAAMKEAKPGTSQRDTSYSDIIPDRTKGVQEVAIIAGDLGFFPKTLFVTRDIPVRMYVTGAAHTSLCIMMDNFHVRKQIRSQEIQEISFTPTAPGKFRYYCPVNGMEGTLVVREFAASR